jgi:hypothetical protein
MDDTVIPANYVARHASFSKNAVGWLLDPKLNNPNYAAGVF